MDSEHRHELEENDLATWLGDKIEQLKPHAPAVGVGIVALIAGVIGLNGYRASQASAQADRWRDFSVAIEGATPDLNMLKQAAETNKGTAVEEWAEITWADGRLFEASSNYFRDRQKSDEAVEEAIAAYEELVSADDRNVAERANFQLGRAYELQGNLEEAAKQYTRVTGAFAQVAQARAEELESNQVKQAYEWITATSTASASTTIDPSENLLGGVEPDEIELPEIDAADADAALDDLLSEVEAETAEADAESDDEEAAEEAEE
ncbi:MAG: hypothetical protein AAF266_12370 [Planctomycetota bacterium]